MTSDEGEADGPILVAHDKGYASVGETSNEGEDGAGETRSERRGC